MSNQTVFEVEVDGVIVLTRTVRTSSYHSELAQLRVYAKRNSKDSWGIYVKKKAFLPKYRKSTTSEDIDKVNRMLSEGKPIRRIESETKLSRRTICRIKQKELHNDFNL